MKVLKAVAYLALAIVAIPIVIGLVWGLGAGIESARLNEFCGRFGSGTKLEHFQSAARDADYAVYDQSNLPPIKADLARTRSREAEIAARLLQTVEKYGRYPSAQTAVIVRKPGIGYYACYVDHNGKAILRTEFVAND